LPTFIKGWKFASGGLQLAWISFISLFDSSKFVWRSGLYREKVLPEARSRQPEACLQKPMAFVITL